jgi:hypothetical protein
MIFFYGHVSLMSAALLLMAAAVVIAAFLRQNRRWLQWHRTLGVTAAVCLVMGLTAAAVMITLSGDGHLKVPHAWLGLMTVLSGAATPVLGHLQFKIPAKIKQIRPWHRRFGYLSLTMMLLSVFSGLVVAGIIHIAA